MQKNVKNNQLKHNMDINKKRLKKACLLLNDDIELKCILWKDPKVREKGEKN